MSFPKLLKSRSRYPLSPWMCLGLAGWLSVGLASAQNLPSDINNPYGRQTVPGLPGSESAPVLGVPIRPQPTPPPVESPLPLPTPPVEIPPSEAISPRIPPVEMGGSGPTGVLPSEQKLPRVQGRAEASGTPEAPKELPPVTLVEEPTVEAGLLNRILTASVTKVQEYPITLETVLKLIEQRNLLIDRDILETRIRDNTFYRSLSELLPDIVGTYTQSRFTGTLQIFGNNTLSVKQDRITPQIRAVWTIYPGGRTVFEALAARQRYKGSLSLLDGTKQQQLAAAANDYYTLLEAMVQVENARLGIEEAKSQLAFDEARFRAGIGTRLDVMRSRTQLARQERLLIDFQNAVGQAEQSLLNRLNLDPDISLVPPVTTARPQPLVPLTWNTNQLVARAARQNPALQSIDAEIQALKSESWAIASDIVPAVTLETYRQRTGPDYDQLGIGTFGGFTVQTNLLDNLGTRIPLDYRNRRLRMKQQTVQRQALLRDIQSQVITAYLDSRANAQGIITSQIELTSAQEAYRLAIGRFRAGLGIALDVLNAQTALNLARVNVTSAILGFNRAQVNLMQAMGDVTAESLLNGLANVQPTPLAPTSKPLPQPSATPLTAPPKATP
jgi:outer membrane protein